MSGDVEGWVVSAGRRLRGGVPDGKGGGCLGYGDSSGDDAGIVAAVDRELGIFHSVHVHRLLLAANGGRRLYGHAPHDGRAGRNTAQDAAGVVGLDLDLAGLGIDAIRIIVLAAAHGGHGKAHAKLHALYGGNAKRDLRDAVLDAVEHGVADACGKPVNAALHDAADAVEFVARG